MATPPLTLDQVRQLLAEGAEPTTKDVVQILRFLFQAQTDLEGRARQLKSTVNRLGR